MGYEIEGRESRYQPVRPPSDPGRLTNEFGLGGNCRAVRSVFPTLVLYDRVYLLFRWNTDDERT